MKVYVVVSNKYNYGEVSVLGTYTNPVKAYDVAVAEVTSYAQSIDTEFAELEENLVDTIDKGVDYVELDDEIRVDIKETELVEG